MITDCDNCIEHDYLLEVPYYQEFFNYDLKYGTKPSRVALDGYGGLPEIYVDKKHGKIYRIYFADMAVNMNRSLHDDYYLFIKGEE